MNIRTTLIPGCYELPCKNFSDSRGSFVKTYHQGEFQALGLRTDWKEEFYSISTKYVLRGMHFQSPPHDHAKLVHCLAGEIFDVVVDVRVGSPTFGECYTKKLSADDGTSLYIPSGLAHGFLSLSNKSIVSYKTTSTHSPEHDSGILWSSIDADWPVDMPTISERDRQHPSIEKYDSPFVFNGKG